jgi:hypothetical protein
MRDSTLSSDTANADPSGAERTGFSATTNHQPRRVRCRHPTRAGDVVVADTIEIEFTAGGSDLR